nr:putative ribonuclease H-like domain-containing protein [Tanacetum cinerariifolium]
MNTMPCGRLSSLEILMKPLKRMQPQPQQVMALQKRDEQLQSSPKTCKRERTMLRSDLDTMSLDDLYNHLKVYESEVLKKSELNLQNMAFISLVKHSSGNEEVNTASVSTPSTNVSPASANIEAASISQDTACAYIASQSNGSQIKFEDINQIHEDYIEEMDIKWNMALLSMRADRLWKKTGKKITMQGIDMAGAPRSQDRGRRDNYRQGSKVEEQTPKVLMAIDGVGWDWSFMANEHEDHALVADEEAPIEFALMAKTSAESKVFDNSLCSKNCKKNTENLNSKITDLNDKLCDSKNMLFHYKAGLSQVKGRLAEFKNQEIKLCEKIRGLELQVEFKTNRIEYLRNKLELLKKEKGYSVVPPPPPTQVYSPPKKDMSWTGLPEFVDDTITNYSKPSPTIESKSDDLQNKNPSITETEPLTSTILSKPDIKFVKSTDRTTEIKTAKVETAKPAVKYAELYRKPSKVSKVKGNQRNWNSLKSQQLDENFVMKNKACFNCGHFDHLSYDYGLWVKNGRSWEKNNNTRKSMSSRPAIHRPYKPRMRPGNSSNYINDKGYWDSGCSRHMTGNISYLTDYEPYDGVYVSFGQGGCKITGKGTIKTGACTGDGWGRGGAFGGKNGLGYCYVSCRFEGLADESTLWHRRLGHLNFKTMNKLVRHNLVRGLPTKCFENDHNCTACLKGKQQKASCKTKLVNSVTKPLHTLHMDLFGPTFVSYLNHKWYFLVVTDDFSRFTWTFFLKTKDETSGILRNFITKIENLKELRVKIIRCDNGGKFRNKEINDFCSRKCIKREFSNARTPQQNGVAEGEIGH